MYLSVLCIVKDEDQKYMIEWHEHHSNLGVEHFYILNHQPNSIPIPDLPNTTIWDVPPARSQSKYYFEALKKISSLWTAIIDADEFIICDKNLQDFMQAYEPHDALGINWLMFGSSNYEDKIYPIKPNYKWRTPCDYINNKHIKSIVKTKNVQRIAGTPHFFGVNTVNEKYDRIKGPHSNFTGELIRINHYFTRSKEDWRLKIDRGRVSCSAKFAPHYQFDKFDKECTVFDLEPTKIHGYKELKKFL